MPAVLATLIEIKRHLGVAPEGSPPNDFSDESTWNTFLQDLVDNVEALLAEECNVTFAASAMLTDEPYDGTGTETFYTANPITTLTSVKIGEDVSDPDDTLSTIPDDLDFDASGRRIIRRGGVWPLGRKNLYVTYVSTAYTPIVAKQALYEGVAFLYRRRGKEHVSSQTIGELGQLEAAARFDMLPAWIRAKRTLRVPVFV